MKTVRAIANACEKLLVKGWEVKKEKGGAIRFRPPNWPDPEFCDCPITAIYRDRLGLPTDSLDFDYGEVYRAARGLRIVAFLKGEVINAADNVIYDCRSEKTEAARLLFLRKLNLPLDMVTDLDLAMVSEKGRKLLKAERARRKLQKAHLNLSRDLRVLT